MTAEMIYEDDCLAVGFKPAGAVSEPSENAPSMHAMLTELTGSQLWTVHRLDRATHGLMVYAKTPEAAAELSRQAASDEMRKRYLAVVQGEVPGSGELTDLLYYDRRVGKSYVVKRERRGVREARLSYERLAVSEIDGSAVSLVSVTLHTGRTHQIRVQFASRKHPIVGDRRYGSAIKSDSIALCAAELSFTHPETGERMSFTCEPAGEAFDHVRSK